MHDLTELIDDLPTEALDLYVMQWEGDGVGEYSGLGYPLRDHPTYRKCRCPRSSLGFEFHCERPGMPNTLISYSTHPAYVIEQMAMDRTLDTEALYRACKAAILARDAAVERVREEVRVG